MFKSQRPERLVFAVAVYAALVLNAMFWRKLFDAVQPAGVYDWAFLAASVVVVVLAFYLILLAVSVKPLLRLLVAILLPAAAAAAYFMSEYGTLIDANMVRNVFETDVRETSDLVTPKLILSVAAFGVLPAVLFCLVPWTERSFRDEAIAKIKLALLSIAVVSAVVFPLLGRFVPLLREHRELKLALTPVNFVSAVTTYWRWEDRKRVKVVAPFGEDARRTTTNGEAARKTFFVVVVGETARSDHFALNGYERPTNPGLSKVADLINFPRAYSCGTDTAQSVPCMFSGLGRENFTNAKADARENVLDILKRTGVDVLWRENQAGGCKNVCARVTTENLTGLAAPTFYPSSQNFDDVLVDGLDERIAKLDRDMVIVLHMMGSHGPAYWKRYPDAFETFKPACKDAQFSRCDLGDVINAYDNTIVYTDHILARLIGVLSKADSSKIDAGMLYVSDHGESLGEHGLYLHGMPYAIAPEAQIHVPMVLWLSPSLVQARGLDQGCLVKRSQDRASQDNLFHSMLGVMNVATRVYDPAFDLFAACRKPAS